MSLNIYQVDAFTDRPFAGNPAAVCLLSEPREDRWMRDVSAEMNLSETAFLVRRGHGFDLRWFTPAVEVEALGAEPLYVGRSKFDYLVELESADPGA